MIRFPKTIENSYARAIKRYVMNMNKVTREIIISAYSKLKKQYEQEIMIDSVNRKTLNDDVDNEIKKIIQLAEMAYISRVDRLPDFEKTAQRFAIITNQSNKKQVETSYKIGTKTAQVPLYSERWVTPMINNFVTENVNLIKSFPVKTFPDLEVILRTNVTQGKSVATLKVAIQKKLNMTSNRANLIARDQIGKLFGSLTKQRNISLGITHFIWRAIGGEDEDVRPADQTNDGEKFSWAKGGFDGTIPGAKIQCRCVGESVFESTKEKK